MANNVSYQVNVSFSVNSTANQALDTANMSLSFTITPAAFPGGAVDVLDFLQKAVEAVKQQ